MNKAAPVVSLVALLLANPAFAHQPASSGSSNEQNLWLFWAWEPGVVIPLAISGWLYVQGIARLWRKIGFGHGIRKWEAACFGGGWLALLIALVSPIHPLGQVLFSVHMTQHEILMLIAAPLMVLGKPVIVFLKAVPPVWARTLAQASKARWWQKTWGTVSNAFVAFVIQAVALWMWHIPALFQAALHSEFVHALQHMTFFLSALLFWWALMEGRRKASGYGLAVLYMFSTALHSGLLGALLTFGTSLWYPDYATKTPFWALSPLQDQQLGGLIMWIPAGLVYVVAGLALFAGWLRESDSRVTGRELDTFSKPAPDPI